MDCTYTFNEILELIDRSNRSEITALCAVLREEKSIFSAYQMRVIAAAINIQLDQLRIAA